MPTSSASENERITSPPKKNSASSTRAVVNEVLMVRLSISLMASLTIFSGSVSRVLRKFSRIRSATTMESFSE